MKKSVDLLDAWIYRVRPYALSKSWNKCFGIGDQKSGTTTLNALMMLMGFNCAPQRDAAITTLPPIIKGDYRAISNFAHHYDFFQDIPFCNGLNFVALDALFPNSKFIYTYRDPNKWYESWVNFYTGKFGCTPKELSKSILRENEFTRQNFRVDIFEKYWLTKASVSQEGLPEASISWDLFFDKEYFIEKFISRQQQVLNYFLNRPNDLLVIDLTKEESIEKIRDFLGMPEFINFSIPHLNQTGKLKPGFTHADKEERPDPTSLKYINPELVKIIKSGTHKTT